MGSIGIPKVVPEDPCGGPMGPWDRWDWASRIPTPSIGLRRERSQGFFELRGKFSAIKKDFPLRSAPRAIPRFQYSQADLGASFWAGHSDFVLIFSQLFYIKFVFFGSGTRFLLFFRRKLALTHDHNLISPQMFLVCP